MKRMPKISFINNIAGWLFITALLTLAAIFAYSAIFFIITHIGLSSFFIYVGAGAVFIGYVSLVILAFINFVI